MSALDTLLADLPSLAEEELPKLVHLASALSEAIKSKASSYTAVAIAELEAATIIADAAETAKFGPKP